MDNILPLSLSYELKGGLLPIFSKFKGKILFEPSGISNIWNFDGVHENYAQNLDFYVVSTIPNSLSEKKINKIAYFIEAETKEPCELSLKNKKKLLSDILSKTPFVYSLQKLDALNEYLTTPDQKTKKPKFSFTTIIPERLDRIQCVFSLEEIIKDKEDRDLLVDIYSVYYQDNSNFGGPNIEIAIGPCPDKKRRKFYEKFKRFIHGCDLKTPIIFRAGAEKILQKPYEFKNDNTKIIDLLKEQKILRELQENSRYALNIIQEGCPEKDINYLKNFIIIS
jgi:hypothetical protein